MGTSHTMLTINDLKPKITLLLDDQPHEILEAKHSHIGRGGAVVEAKIRNLKTGSVFTRSFKAADTFEETELEKQRAKFLYSHRGTFWFENVDQSKNRFSLEEKALPENIRKFLKQNSEVEILSWENQILTIELPVKLALKVIEAPPGIRGDTAQGGTKMVTLESGAQIQVPLFISEGDIILVNTETGKYVQRAGKAS